MPLLTNYFALELLFFSSLSISSKGVYLRVLHWTLVLMATFFVENSKAEGARLQAESEALDSQTHEFRGLDFTFRGLPTLTDGKVKVMWSDWEAKAMTNCLICRAGPKELSQRRSKAFKPNTNHFKFGIGNVLLWFISWHFCPLCGWCDWAYVYEVRTLGKLGEGSLGMFNMSWVSFEIMNMCWKS